MPAVRPAHRSSAPRGDGMTVILAVVAAALLFPVLVFIAGATRLSAARREQRYAAMRLVGATPDQVAVVAAVESAVAAIVGVVAGFGLFVALRPVLADIPFTGDPFFTSDLALTCARRAGRRRRDPGGGGDRRPLRPAPCRDVAARCHPSHDRAPHARLASAAAHRRGGMARLPRLVQRHRREQRQQRGRRWRTSPAPSR